MSSRTACPGKEIAAFCGRGNGELSFPVVVALLFIAICEDKLGFGAFCSVGEVKPNREVVLVDVFSAGLANIGGYKFVAAIPVFRPLNRHFGSGAN